MIARSFTHHFFGHGFPPQRGSRTAVALVTALMLSLAPSSSHSALAASAPEVPERFIPTRILYGVTSSTHIFVGVTRRLEVRSAAGTVIRPTPVYVGEEQSVRLMVQVREGLFPRGWRPAGMVTVRLEGASFGVKALQTEYLGKPLIYLTRVVLPKGLAPYWLPSNGWHLEEGLSSRAEIEFVIRTQAPRGRGRNEKVNARIIDFTVPGEVPALAQPNTMACWATAATMLMAWKEGRRLRIESVVDRAGAPFRTRYDQNTGLPPEEKPAFLRALGLRTEPPQNLSVDGWPVFLKEHGVLWLTTQDRKGRPFSVHARLVRGITGDGSVDGTFLSIIDPEDGRAYRESIMEFTRKYEAVARQDLKLREENPEIDLAPQIIHW
jgi:hypothetical protein